jgi:hypothetical protein
MGERRYSSAILTSAPDVGERLASRPSHFNPLYRKLVDPGAGLNTVVKRTFSCSHPELNPNSLAVQPVARLYTDLAL